MKTEKKNQGKFFLSQCVVENWYWYRKSENENRKDNQGKFF